MSTTTEPKPLAGKVAIVTGGSKGIGRAISLKLASLGANVVVNYSNDAAAASTVVNEIGTEHSIAVQGDASKVSEIEKLVDETISRFGKVDILVPCAGVMMLNDLEKITEEAFDKTMNLNVKGPLFLVKKASPLMAPGGRIILFSTSLCAASTLTPNYTLYITSKGAIEQLTRGLSKELSKKGIMVNAIAPGPTATDLFLEGKSEQLLKMIAGFNPQNRIGKPEEIAEVAAFLSGEGSSWVTGQVIRTNGGFV